MITLSDEVREILSNAREAHLAGEITDEQFHGVIRSLLRDVEAKTTRFVSPERMMRND